MLDRLWYTVPDGLSREPAIATVDFAGEVSAGAPRVRLSPGDRDFALVPSPTPTRWTARIDLAGIPAGVYKVGVVERVSGTDVPIDGNTAGTELRLSQPEYVVWTLDFEGDASSDEALANTAAIADGLKVPMTVMWNPRVWTTTAVSSQRADAMLAWTKGRVAKGDEVALHLHMWTDLVRSASVTPRTEPSWAGRGDGYDVPMYAYDEDEARRILDRALALFAEHGLPRPTSFRAASFMVRAHTLRAVAAAGFTADCSAAAAGSVGRLAYPWSLAPDAQPFRPSRDDHQRPGDFPLLEVPTNGGNTFGHSAASIQPVIRTDLAMLAPPGTVATERRAVTFVSHPSTLNATERGAVEALVAAFAPLRYDRDSGSVRFVTLRELAQAYSR